MKRLRTSTWSHELGLKFRPSLLSPVHPMQIPPTSWGAAPGGALGSGGYGGSPRAAGKSSSHHPSQGPGQAGLKRVLERLGRAIKGHECPRQGLAAPPSPVPLWSKITSSSGGRGERNLTFREADSYFHSKAINCRSPSQAAFEIPTDFIAFTIVYFIIYPIDFIYSWGVESLGPCQRSVVGIREEQLRTAWYLIIGCKYLLQIPLFATLLLGMGDYWISFIYIFLKGELGTLIKLHFKFTDNEAVYSHQKSNPLIQ